MNLFGLLLLPFFGGLIAWGVGGRGARLVSLLVLVVDLAFALALFWPQRGGYVAEMDWPWIPELGIHLHLALDGLSLLLVILTLLLGLMAVAASFESIQERVGLFHLALLWSLVGILGVLLATDLFLFYLFWELMSVPVYFLIGIWGSERRNHAAIKLLLFTQTSGLFMLLAIFGLWWIHHDATGRFTFDALTLSQALMARPTARWLLAGFVVAFFVKLPVVPLHTWLPDAHAAAPTAGNLVLILLEVGGYGLLRFVLPLFPEAALAFAPIAFIFGIIGIYYGALLAAAQTDLKRLLAYASISHAGFVLIGLFAGSELAFTGAIVELITQNLAGASLFLLTGALEERLRTHELGRLGGLFSAAPRLGACTLFAGLATLGLPGLGTFIGEILILLGTWPRHPVVAILAAFGLVPVMIYALRLLQRVLYGAAPQPWQLADLKGRELFSQAVLIALLLWLGLFPQPALDRIGAAWLQRLPARHASR